MDGLYFYNRTDQNSLPNPVRNYLEISFVINTNLQQVSLEIIDIKGRKVFLEKYGNLSGSFLQKVDVSELTSGTYFVKILAQEGEFTKKII